MKTLYFNVGRMLTLNIGKQYDHKANRIIFTNANFAGENFINVEYKNLDGEVENEMYELSKVDDGYCLEIGYPLTSNTFGEIKAQLFGSVYSDSGELTKKELSGVFTFILDESLRQGDLSEYPIDPIMPIKKIDEVVEEKVKEAIKDIVIPDKEQDSHGLDNYVIAWGDSRIANGGQTNSVGKYLANMLGVSYRDKGYGSHGSGEVAFSMWANEVYVSLEGNGLKANENSNKIVNMRVTAGSANQNFMQNSSDYAKGSPCNLGGYGGYIYRYNGNAYFVPNTPPTSFIPIQQLTRVFPQNQNAGRYGFTIIWVGKNDFTNYTASGFDSYLTDTVSCMCDYVRRFSNKFVVLGETASNSDSYKIGGNARTMMDKYNTIMKNRYPNNFIDIHKELSERGLSMAGITPTEEDTQALADGLLPPSLMSDDVHQNPKCREVIAKIIKEHMEKQNWI